MADIEIEGIGELQNQLSTLPSKVRDKILVRAITKSANIVKQAAITKAPMGKSKHLYRQWSKSEKTWKEQSLPHGLLKRSFSVKIDKTNPWYTEANPYVKKGRKAAWYGHMVEFGHRIVFVVGRNKKKIVRGTYPARPFLRPAFEETREQVIAEFKNEIAKNIERVALGKNV